MVSESYTIHDYYRYSSSTYSSSTTVNWSLPTNFKLEFILNSNSATSNNAPMVRFNNASSIFIGKASSSSRNGIWGDGQWTVIGDIPVSTDTEYVLTYENNIATITDGTNTITMNVSTDLTSIYGVIGFSNGVIKNIRITQL